MKYFSIPTLVLLITLLISACGAGGTQAAPTFSADDVQNTVIVAALTVVAETQAAVPSFTPPPPTATFTHTPAVTSTFPVLPTLDGTFTPVPSGGNSGSDDPCIHKVLPASLEGETVRMRVDNSTRDTVSVSVYLQQATPQSECGYRSYTLEPGQFVVINDLIEGCYTLWAWNPDPDNYFIATNGTSCLNDSEPWAFDISTSSIKLEP